MTGQTVQSKTVQDGARRSNLFPKCLIVSDHLKRSETVQVGPRRSETVQESQRQSKAIQDSRRQSETVGDSTHCIGSS